MKTEGIMKQDDGSMMSPGMMPPQRMSALHRPRGKMRGSHPKPPTVEIPLEEAAKRVSFFFFGFNESGRFLHVSMGPGSVLKYQLLVSW